MNEPVLIFCTQLKDFKYCYERKAPKRCTFSPDDPKTSMELNCLVEMRMAQGAFSIRSLSGEFLLLAE